MGAACFSAAGFFCSAGASPRSVLATGSGAVGDAAGDAALSSVKMASIVWNDWQSCATSASLSTAAKRWWNVAMCAPTSALRKPVMVRFSSAAVSSGKRSSGDSTIPSSDASASMFVRKWKSCAYKAANGATVRASFVRHKRIGRRSRSWAKAHSGRRHWAWRPIWNVAKAMNLIASVIPGTISGDSFGCVSDAVSCFSSVFVCSCRYSSAVLSTKLVDSRMC
mmetsp:Transcript_43590/g.134626  ORF Transcript_43590/g.134626 Transcript_43590/m.134626 type:complete len:223 (-) Transcript_43590:390-1058(-)